ncbi:MAG TPA: YeeE/YedE thiosulfate transporter family protein [Acetobacteraceae bacterium]|nr:YeeE/YedE thiosulfate transporter family protein [Acetobacteraceae bacterium]
MKSVLFLVALAAVGMMGFANQRGGTCTVAAIEDIVAEHRFDKLTALFEASLWVAGGLILLATFGWLPEMPASYATGIATILGGALFGIGAFVNRACAFGSVARLGSGDWAYLATPAGFYLGALLTTHVSHPLPLIEQSILIDTPQWLAILVAALLAARIFSHGWKIRRSERSVLDHVWSPHLATTVIGISFLVALVSMGPWDYTILLTDLADGAMRGFASHLALNLALLGGAIAGGWTAGRLKPVLPEPRRLIRSLVGGTIMGLGSRLIPGGNTGLVLVGLPLLRPYAWLALASMCLTIYAAIRLRYRVHAGRTPSTVRH